MKNEQLANVDRYLQIILTDLSSVTRMMEDQQPCNQILQKIGTIQHALRILGCSLIICQAQESIVFLQNNPDPGAGAIEITRLRDLYTEILRSQYSR